MENMLERLGRSTAFHPWRSLAAWLLAAVALLGLGQLTGGTFVDDFRIPGVDSQRAADLGRDHFPGFGAASAEVVWHARTGTLHDPQVARRYYAEGGWRDDTLYSLLREHARVLEEARGRAAEIAATEERARIARELHDVIAHSIGAMTVQAGAARTLLRDDPARARESIEAVEETGREALAETRRLLGILRRDVAAPALAPQPGLAALDRLVDAARADGLTVELAVDGAPRQLPAGRDLAAYRIVQDGLARACGRDGVTRVHVRLRWRPDALEIDIDDDGRVGTGGGGDGPVELAAMRERLALYDGTIEARRRSDGVSSVRARLPLEAAS